MKTLFVGHRGVPNLTPPSLTDEMISNALFRNRGASSRLRSAMSSDLSQRQNRKNRRRAHAAGSKKAFA